MQQSKGRPGRTKKQSLGKENWAAARFAPYRSPTRVGFELVASLDWRSSRLSTADHDADFYDETVSNDASHAATELVDSSVGLSSGDFRFVHCKETKTFRICPALSFVFPNLGRSPFPLSSTLTVSTIVDAHSSESWATMLLEALSGQRVLRSILNSGIYFTTAPQGREYLERVLALSALCCCVSIQLFGTS